MGLPVIVKKVKRNVYDYGTLAAAGKVFRYLLRPLFEYTSYRVYAIDLTGLAVPRVERDDVAFRIVGPEDAGIIAQITGMEEWLAGTLKTKLLQGGLCIAAMKGQKVAGFNLIAFSKVYLPLVRLHKRLQPGEAWSEQITVAHEYRKKKLAADIRYVTFQHLQERGVAKLYGAALISNTASLYLAQRVGFRYIEDIHYVNLFGYKIRKYRRIM
jgi:hypothetical protein